MEQLVNLYKGLGDANRLNILQLLSGHELSVCEIMQGLNLSQPAVSHHLKILRQADLVESVKTWKTGAIHPQDLRIKTYLSVSG